MSEERRAEARQRVSLQAHYRVGKEQRSGSLVDLCGDGVFVCTHQPLEPGARLDLTIRTPGDRGYVYTNGLVVWTNLVHTEAVPAGMGIRFLSVDPEGRDRLQAQLNPSS